MDVNGTKFHLLYGCDDWGSCTLQDTTTTNTLQSLWGQRDMHPPLEWDGGMASLGALRLAREVPLFRQRIDTPPLDLGLRRGAGRDRAGNWYWIDEHEQSIRCLRAGTFSPIVFWPSDSQGVTGEGRERHSSAHRREAEGAFVALAPGQDPHISTTQHQDRHKAPTSLPPSSLSLRGLAVTTRNYMVVGDVTNQGLLLFDLHSGGNPILQRWPGTVHFAPWDMAPTPDGGLLILDRDHSRYWKLDCHLLLIADGEKEEELVFQPTPPLTPSPFLTCSDAPCGRQGWGQGRRQGPGQGWRRWTRTTYTYGYPLKKADGVTPLAEAISIEPGPDGQVLILETDVKQGSSAIYQYAGAQQIHVYRLDDAAHKVEIIDPLAGEEGVPEFYAVIAHDFAYIEDSLMLYVADHKGKQSFGFRLDTQQGQLLDDRAYLPLRRWGGKGIVAVDGQVQYDFLDERWVPSMVFAECHYARMAVLTTPTNFTVPDESGDSVDGTTSTNGAGTQAMVPSNPTQPVVPGRPFDSNIPGCVWHRLLLDAQIPPGCDISIRARAADDPLLLPLSNWQPQPPLYLRSGGAELPYYNPWRDLQPLPEGTGTWEILLQNIEGRYLQLELTMSGTGRATPALRALRAWYPRFSYLDHYLPALYREDDLAASFLERWLANFEGLYTNLEDKIEHVALLFDPRTAPPDVLEWLACWFGMVLDPLWEEERRRILIRNIDQLYRRRGTAFGVEVAVRLYIEPNITESVFDPRYLGTGSVRIVEQFLTRDIGSLGGGAVAAQSNSESVQGNAELRQQAYLLAAQSAHRFIVLVTRDLSDEQVEMVQRIVELEKPAHTTFVLNRSWESFRVGEAQLGQDTLLGEGYRFTQQSLGESYLGDTYLDIPYPEHLTDRIVLQRNGLNIQYPEHLTTAFQRSDLGTTLPPL